MAVSARVLVSRNVLDTVSSVVSDRDGVRSDAETVSSLVVDSVAVAFTVMDCVAESGELGDSVLLGEIFMVVVGSLEAVGTREWEGLGVTVHALLVRAAGEFVELPLESYVTVGVELTVLLGERVTIELAVGDKVSSVLDFVAERVRPVDSEAVKVPVGRLRVAEIVACQLNDSSVSETVDEPLLIKDLEIA